METSIIKIGNSKGLILSKMIIEKYDLGEKVEVILEEDHIVLRPIRKIRDGWGEAFARMRAAGDDKLLIDDFMDEDHIEEWK